MQQSVYETKICDIYDLQKTLDANLGWLWTERYRGCSWPVVQASGIMCAGWRRTLWTHAVKLLFFVLCGSSEHFMTLLT